MRFDGHVYVFVIHSIQFDSKRKPNNFREDFKSRWHIFSIFFFIFFFKFNEILLHERLCFILHLVCMWMHFLCAYQQISFIYLFFFFLHFIWLLDMSLFTASVWNNADVQSPSRHTVCTRDHRIEIIFIFTYICFHDS